ncbi:MAG: cytochrome P450 [Herpetosiphon sp.]
MSLVTKYDLYSQQFRATAYETYAAMRRDDPVFCQPGLDGQTPIWFVTRYDDVEAILRDEKHFVRDVRNALPAEMLSQFAERPAVMELVENHMLNKDGLDHRRLRSLVSKVFTARVIERMRPRIHAIAHELLDQVQTQGTMDVVEAYAFPLPIIVIAELLGVPAADRHRFRHWSDVFVTPAVSRDAIEAFIVVMHEFTGYLRQLFDERRQQPQDDLISGLLQAEESGDRLSEAELFSMVVLLIVAGHETTVSLIGNGVLALLQHPDEAAQLRRNPAGMAGAVEELLRYDGAVERALMRWVAEDVEFRGHTMRRGELVAPVLAAANRDESHFSAAERFDLTRRVDRHLAFGMGVHYCLGAPLARLEAEVALQTLLERLPHLRLAVEADQLRWRLVPLFRSLAALPVAWSQAAIT